MHDLPELYLYILPSHRLEKRFNLFVSQTQQNTNNYRKHPYYQMESVNVESEPNKSP